MNKNSAGIPGLTDKYAIMCSRGGRPLSQEEKQYLFRDRTKAGLLESEEKRYARRIDG